MNDKVNGYFRLHLKRAYLIILVPYAIKIRLKSSLFTRISRPKIYIHILAPELELIMIDSKSLVKLRCSLKLSVYSLKCGRPDLK
jgi:hypothetical protein